eukprot:TRINITY_DN111689_c0_g1_i1.p1 TRINITY_DN111689_c0_g1~~TRINITY_DN111689_c0_g1_i1.p1  ORF type:complete len:281 (+),score=60.22 TRINITY_DN111689_c0_g1_i1:63-845(+)
MASESSDIETFVGTPEVLNAIFFFLGLAMVIAGRRAPTVVAALAAVALGLWTGVVVQGWQEYGTPLGFQLAGGIWVPIVCAVVVACVAGVLIMTMWKVALAILTALMLATVVVAILRFADLEPETLFDSGLALLSRYSVVGIIVFVVALVLLMSLVHKFYEAMFLFAAIHLGTLLLVSGASYFVQLWKGDATITTVIDGLAAMVSDAFKGECSEWESCDCDDTCRAGIASWIVLSWFFMFLHVFVPRCVAKRKAESKAPA